MKVLKFVFGGIAKAIGYLMITLGLWLPALFTVTFFITCAATHTVLSKSVMAVFYCGLGITAVAGLALAMHLKARNKQKGTAVRAESRKEKKKKKSETPMQSQSEVGHRSHGQNGMPPYIPSAYSSPYPPSYGYPQTYGDYPPQNGPYPSDGYMQSGTYPPPANGYRRTDPSAGVRESKSYDGRDNVTDLKRKYFPDGVPTAAESYARTASFEEDIKPNTFSSDRSLGAEELWRRLSGADVPDEQPLVFRTRKDANVYVYEYSDRYQYWRRTKTGMVLERTEFKENERSVKNR